MRIESIRAISRDELAAIKQAWVEQYDRNVVALREVALRAKADEQSRYDMQAKHYDEQAVAGAWVIRSTTNAPIAADGMTHTDERPPEHWHEVRRSRSGPFTLHR